MISVREKRIKMNKLTADELRVGRGEERVRCVERVTWKFTLPYVK